MVFWLLVLKIKEQEKLKKIVITNDKGRLSQEEIDQMLREAEEFAE